MASNVYATARQGFLDGSITWTTGTFKVMLVSAAYTPSVATDQFVSVIPPLAIIARSATLTGLSATGGAARAADLTISAVSGPSVAYLVIYQDTGSDATSRLICYIGDGTGIPVTPNGGDISISWSTGADHIFSI